MNGQTKYLLSALVVVVGFMFPLVFVASAAASEAAFNNENTAAVSNNPTGGNPQFTLTSYSKLDYLRTYHWNNGRGATLGTIWLKGGPNNLSYGPWKATASATFWVVQPTNTYLPPGTYTIYDSDPATWSYNAQSGGKGFAMVNVTRIDLSRLSNDDVKGTVSLAVAQDRVPITDALSDDKKGPVQALLSLRPFPSVIVDKPTVALGQVATVTVLNPYPGWRYYFEASGPGAWTSPSSGPLTYQLKPGQRGTYTVIVKTKVGSVASVPPSEMQRIQINVQ
jgi:hypothetical protein